MPRAIGTLPYAAPELALEQPALASCYGTSLSDRQLLGAAPGERTRKLVHPVRELSSADEGLAEVERLALAGEPSALGNR